MLALLDLQQNQHSPHAYGKSPNAVRRSRRKYHYIPIVGHGVGLCLVYSLAGLVFVALIVYGHGAPGQSLSLVVTIRLYLG